jgi:hypothetical protein
MRSSTGFIIPAVCSFVLLGIAQFDRVRPAHAQEPQASALAVIVGRDLDVRSIDSGTLRRVFRGETTELGGKRLIPFNYGARDPLRVSFDQQLLAWSPEQAGRYWVDRRVRGQTQAPRVVATPLAMRSWVAKVDGAIGYVPTSLVRGDVHVLRVDDRAPSDQGYALDALR